MKNIILLIKGFIMGIANIIPGVSGGTLALTLGIYEDLIGAISHFFASFKDNIKLILPIAMGMGLSILTMSNVITAAFEHFPIPTTLFFMGLVIGGIPMLFHKIKDKKEMKKVSSYVIFFMTLLLVLILAFSQEIFGGTLADADFSNLSFFGYIGISMIGVIAAGTMIIPGVSGSLVLMLLGYYLPIINVVKELTHFENIFPNILVVVFFAIGVLIGIILIAKLIEWLLAKYETKTYFGVLGFIIASIIAIPVSVYHEIGKVIFSVPQVLFGVVFLLIGTSIGYMLGEK